jgi:ribosomal protein S18 acetylase RimI-like enzyme
MTRSVDQPPGPFPPSPPAGFAVVRVGEDALVHAAERLVSQGLRDRRTAAKRLIASAPEHGIDLSAIWATVQRPGVEPLAIRQACLAVPGSGATAMIFISEPMPGGEPGGPESARAERIALLRQVAAHFVETRTPKVKILQALPDLADAWAESAFRGAGFVYVGDLEYQRRAIAPADLRGSRTETPWPEGVRVAPLTSFPESQRDAMLLKVLEESYQDTLDCPELCGLRETPDILASHYATGVFDPSIWFIVMHREGAGEVARGCMLLSRVPEQRVVELVYIGLSPEVRGKGLGRRLLDLGIRNAAEARLDAVTCAVDCRNDPARRLYQDHGFQGAGRRKAFVGRVADVAPTGT